MQHENFFARRHLNHCIQSPFHETISQQRHVLRDITKNGYEFLTVVPYSSCINTYSSFSDDVAIRLGIFVPDFDVI